MFSTPILDVAIGLVFIFLIYSLLATSVKEGIATALALRASMLRAGIIEGMLSDTPKNGRIESLLIGLASPFDGIFYRINRKRPFKDWITGQPEYVYDLGVRFYDHAIIKNYGASRIYPYPSYIAPDNFSLVLIDVLKDEYLERVDAAAALDEGKKNIVYWMINQSGGNAAFADVKNQMMTAPDAVKIKTLLDFYAAYYKTIDLPLNNAARIDEQYFNGEIGIDKEPVKILRLHLLHAEFVIAGFSKNLQDWFNDSMNRVTGWYKRQVQTILFLLGLAMAISLNIDTIGMAKKLSKDKTLRAQMVQMSQTELNKLKTVVDAQRTSEKSVNMSDADVKKANDDYNAGMTKLHDQLNKDQDDISRLMALGWDEESYCDFSSSQKASKILGLVITAFAISLGAPFWFDLMNQLVSMRGSGVKENGSDTNATPPAKTATPPVAINLNTNQTGTEAVG